MVKGRLQATPAGVPQVGPLSPLLANILFDDLDKELERRGHHFVRYADDFIMSQFMEENHLRWDSLGEFLALAAQDEDLTLKKAFLPAAKALEDNQDKIIQELNQVQGRPVDMGGYYHPSAERAAKEMRPSITFNAIINNLSRQE